MIEQRREILYIYDAKYCNPNGDPADENKPRMDPETQINLVSDVRLKRTIRDYLHEVKGQGLFVLALPDDEGGLPDGKARADEFRSTDLPDTATYGEIRKQIDQKIIGSCIDVRLFGCTIPLDLDVKVKGKKKKETGSIIHTGGVQFKIGKSLHKVTVERIKGTGAFAAKKGAKQNTFRTDYITPYSCISFYGVVNEYRGKEVELSDEDLELMYEGMWMGTKHLITRSKIGQTPRLLLVVRYKKGKFQISDLDNKVKLVSELDEFAIRSTDDFVLNIDRLLDALVKHKKKIDGLEIEVDDSLQIQAGGKIYSGLSDVSGLLEDKGFTVKHLNLE